MILRAGELEATFVPEAGMVGASLRHRGEELLGQREGLDAYVERSKTMGIPFLHPWANRLSAEAFAVGGRQVDLAAAGPLVRREEHGLPNHGLLGGRTAWAVQEQGEDALRASWASGSDPRVDAAFPFPHAVEIAVALAPDGLTITTTLEATGEVAVPVAFGWHPYLAPPGAEREEWELALPERTQIATDDRALPTGERRPLGAERAALGDRTLDDGFDGLAPGASASVAGGGRRLTIEWTDGYPAGQVFAPPGQALVALEPMTAPVDALVTGDGLRFAEPGGPPFTATFRLRVEAR